MAIIKKVFYDKLIAPRKSYAFYVPLVFYFISLLQI